MTTKEIEKLLPLWRTSAPAPRLPDPWATDTVAPRHREMSERMAAREMPWFGWRLTSDLTNSVSPYPIPDEPYRWVLKGYEYQASGREGKYSSDPDCIVVGEALILRVDEQFKAVIEAALITREATVENVAQALGLEPKVVEAYACLFFNVLDRKDDLTFRRNLVYPDTRLVELDETEAFQPPRDRLLLRAGYNGTLRDVLIAAGYSLEPEVEADGMSDTKAHFQQSSAMTSALVSMGLHHRADPPKVLADEMAYARKVSKTDEVQTLNDTNGDFHIFARAILKQDSELLQGTANRRQVAPQETPATGTEG